MVNRTHYCYNKSLQKGKQMVVQDPISKHDFLYYELKELNQKLEYWQNEASYKTRGAKVRVSNLKSKINDARQEFQELSHSLGYAY